jgi:hypothetical protein
VVRSVWSVSIFGHAQNQATGPSGERSGKRAHHFAPISTCRKCNLLGYTSRVIPVDPRIKLWLDLSYALAVAAATGARRLQSALRPRRTAAYRTRRPGADSPMWNVCAKLLRERLRPYGSKARLARYLGVPRQRLNDFLKGRRLPDAELMLRMLHWLNERANGRDPAL